MTDWWIAVYEDGFAMTTLSLWTEPPQGITMFCGFECNGVRLPRRQYTIILYTRRWPQIVVLGPGCYIWVCMCVCVIHWLQLESPIRQHSHERLDTCWWLQDSHWSWSHSWFVKAASEYLRYICMAPSQDTARCVGVSSFEKQPTLACWNGKELLQQCECRTVTWY